MFTTKAELNETKQLLAQANARATQSEADAQQARRIVLSIAADLEAAQALLSKKDEDLAAAQALLVQNSGSSPFIKIGSSRLLASGIYHIETNSDDEVTGFNGRPFSPSVPLRGSELETLIADRLNRKK